MPPALAIVVRPMRELARAAPSWRLASPSSLGESAALLRMRKRRLVFLPRLFDSCGTTKAAPGGQSSWRLLLTAPTVAQHVDPLEQQPQRLSGVRVLIDAQEARVARAPVLASFLAATRSPTGRKDRESMSFACRRRLAVFSWPCCGSLSSFHQAAARAVCSFVGAFAENRNVKRKGIIVKLPGRQVVWRLVGNPSAYASLRRPASLEFYLFIVAT
jgi:hypothetical protein